MQVSLMRCKQKTGTIDVESSNHSEAVPYLDVRFCNQTLVSVEIKPPLVLVDVTQDPKRLIHPK